MDIWTFDDQTWRRAPGNGFELGAYRGLDAADKLHGTHELAALVGAHECPEEGAGVLYPGPFRHSPATGKSLPAIPAPLTQTWLPPFGNSPALSCLGLRQTALALDLSAGSPAQDAPDASLPLPPPGEYQFMVGNFKARVPVLLAAAPRKGLLYLYAGRGWVELKNQGKLLPESSLAAPRWGVCLAEAEENRLYLPTDEGLAVLNVNVLKADYQLGLIPARCLGAPAVLGGWVMVPALDGAGRGGVLRVSLLDASRTDWLDCAAAGGGGAYNVPLAEQRQVLWLNSHGQLKLSLNADKQPTASLIPWQDGDIPRFEFGSAYARNGALWQICYDRMGERYQYVQLGRLNPDKHPCRSPRLGSGTASFAQSSQFHGPPWSEEEVAYDAAAKAVVIPLLETANDAVLCVRIDWVRGLEELFASSRPHLARYELIGRDGDRPLFSQKLSKPWLAQPFVHRGRLYLYHPDIKPMPGWNLA